MGTSASVHTNNFFSNGHELYLVLSKLVTLQEEILCTTRVNSAAAQLNGDLLITQAQELDETAQTLEFIGNLDEIIENQKQILLDVKREQVLTYARAKLYCVAALLEYRSIHLFNLALPFIQQMLDKNIEILNVLYEVYENKTATQENKVIAHNKYIALASNLTAHENAAIQAKHFQQYGILCREKSKLVFMCANNPEKFESSSDELKDINSLFNLSAIEITR